MDVNEASRLGRLLATAEGYQVLSSDGRYIGVVDHVRYRQHADHPDEISIRRRNVLWKRRRLIPFSAIEKVDERNRTIAVRLTAEEIERRREG